MKSLRNLKSNITAHQICPKTVILSVAQFILDTIHLHRIFDKVSLHTITSPQTSITIMKKMPPVTKAELANIDGMGGQRVAISGEAILATIYAFLEVWVKLMI